MHKHNMINHTKNENIRIKHIDNFGNTALIKACQNNTPKIALRLIRSGNSHPEHINNKGQSSLLWACYNNMSEVALELIKTNCSVPNQINHNRNTALIWACYNEMHDVALKLIDTNCSIPEHINNAGYTALNIACHKKMSFVALKLIETNNSVPEQIDNNHNTALIWACANNMKDVAHKLIETKKSIPYHVNNEGHSALTWAFFNGMLNVCELLFSAHYGIITNRNKLIGQINCLVDNHENHINIYSKFIERLIISKMKNSKSAEILVYVDLIDQLIKNNHQNIMKILLNEFDINIVANICQNERFRNVDLTQCMSQELKDKIFNKIVSNNQNKNANKQCIICLDEMNIMNVLIPCGHGLFCLNCVSKLERKVCPHCRVTIQNSLTIYF